VRITISLLALGLLLGLAPRALAEREFVPVSGSAIASGWMPADPGNRWTYVYARERSRSVDGADETTETLRGTLTEEVVGRSPDYGPGVVEVRSVLRGRGERDPTETVEKQRRFLRASGASLRILAREATDPLAGSTELVRFSPPLEAIKAGIGTGETWKLGVERQGGVQTELEGEVLGLQDARTPAGLYPKCLVVRHVGTMSGAVDLNGTRIELRDGRFSSTEWFAPGVGRVLAKRERVQTLVLADGSTAVISEQTQLALSEVAVAGEESKGPSGAEGIATPSSAPAAPAESSVKSAEENPAPAQPAPGATEPGS
jgi:hypothetical protein